MKKLTDEEEQLLGEITDRAVETINSMVLPLCDDNGQIAAVALACALANLCADEDIDPNHTCDIIKRHFKDLIDDMKELETSLAGKIVVEDHQNTGFLVVLVNYDNPNEDGDPDFVDAFEVPSISEYMEKRNKIQAGMSTKAVGKSLDDKYASKDIQEVEKVLSKHGLSLEDFSDDAITPPGVKIYLFSKDKMVAESPDNEIH